MTASASGDTSSLEISVIDLSDFEDRKHEIAKRLHAAAKDVGFFYIKGHGIPKERIDAAFRAGQSFHELPDSAKHKSPWNPDRYLGWRSQSDLFTVTGSKLWEWVSFGRYGTGGYDARQQEFLGSHWPDDLGDSFRDKCLSFQAETHQVALKVLRALALSLGRDEHEFTEPFDFDSQESSSFIAWNRYPAVTGDAPTGPTRLHAHADGDIITLLYQRAGEVGLEIAPGKDIDDNPALQEIGAVWNTVPTAKRWIPLDPIEGCITVNIGDGLQWWTDGLFKSTYHRVRAPRGNDNKGPRMSMPYFVTPRLNFIIQGPEKKYPPITSFELLSMVGSAYEARKNDAKSNWKQQAYGAVRGEDTRQLNEHLNTEAFSTSAAPIVAN